MNKIKNQDQLISQKIKENININYNIDGCDVKFIVEIKNANILNIAHMLMKHMRTTGKKQSNIASIFVHEILNIIQNEFNQESRELESEIIINDNSIQAIKEAFITFGRNGRNLIIDAHAYLLPIKPILDLEKLKDIELIGIKNIDEKYPETENNYIKKIICKQFIEYIDKDGKCEKGDKVEIEFIVDGESEKLNIILGEKLLRPEIEEKIMDHEIGHSFKQNINVQNIMRELTTNNDKKQLNRSIMNELRTYKANDIDCEIKITKIQKMHEPEFDNKIMEKIGIKDEKVLEKYIKDSIDLAVQQINMIYFSNQILNKFKEYSFSIPQYRIDNGLNNMRDRWSKAFNLDGGKDGDPDFENAFFENFKKIDNTVSSYKEIMGIFADKLHKIECSRYMQGSIAKAIVLNEDSVMSNFMKNYQSEIKNKGILKAYNELKPLLATDELMKHIKETKAFELKEFNSIDDANKYVMEQLKNTSDPYFRFSLEEEVLDSFSINI